MMTRSYRRLSLRPLTSIGGITKNVFTLTSHGVPMPHQALIVIDIQNDYFPDGKFPQWNADATLANIEAAINKARERKIPVILVQHIADATKGVAPFFNEGTSGVDIHPRILAAAPDATIVTKSVADSFHHTTL